MRYYIIQNNNDGETKMNNVSNENKIKTSFNLMPKSDEILKNIAKKYDITCGKVVDIMFHYYQKADRKTQKEIMKTYIDIIDDLDEE